MKQTRAQSVIEAVMGTVLAFITGVVIGQWIVYPLFGIHPSIWTNINMTLAFTVVSMTRAYLVRRFFNWWFHR
jgi:ABC-type antimicrobial peptide transport system permease subunit